MATKVKVEFVLEEPDKDAAINIKSGDVLIVRQVEPEAPAVEGSAAAATPLGCFTSDGKMVGLVPQAAARQVAGFGDAQASVRSIKRDTTGAVSQLMLRVVLTEDGPMQLAKDVKPPAAAATAVPYPDNDDDGFRLRHKQLEQLVHSTELRTTLKDERLQGLLAKIDAAPDREKALEAALQAPAFQAFADTVLGLLDAGAVAAACHT